MISSLVPRITARHFDGEERETETDRPIDEGGPNMEATRTSRTTGLRSIELRRGRSTWHWRASTRH